MYRQIEMLFYFTFSIDQIDMWDSLVIVANQKLEDLMKRSSIYLNKMNVLTMLKMAFWLQNMTITCRHK